MDKIRQGQIYQRTVDETSGESTLSAIELEDIDFSEKKFFCQPGIETLAFGMNHEHKVVSGFMKVIEGGAGGPEIHKSGMQLLSFPYLGGLHAHMVAIGGLLGKEQEFSDVVMESAGPALLKMVTSDGVITRNNGAWKIEGERLHLDDVMQNFIKTSHLGHSRGSAFIQECCHIDNIIMREVGFIPQDIARAIPQKVAITIGNIIEPMKPSITGPYCYTSVRFTAINDEIAWRVMGNKGTTIPANHDGISIVQYSDHEVLVMADMPTKIKRRRFINDDHFEVEPHKDRGAHSVQLYTTQGEHQSR